MATRKKMKFAGGGTPQNTHQDIMDMVIGNKPNPNNYQLSDAIKMMKAQKQQDVANKAYSDARGAEAKKLASPPASASSEHSKPGGSVQQQSTQMPPRTPVTMRTPSMPPNMGARPMPQMPPRTPATATQGSLSGATGQQVPPGTSKPGGLVQQQSTQMPPRTPGGAPKMFAKGGETMATKKNPGFMAMMAKKKGGESESLAKHAAKPASKAHAGLKAGGPAKKMASGGYTSAADGVATKGKTKAKQVKMMSGGKC